MDTFIEQIIQKKKSAKEWCIVIAVAVAALALTLVLWGLLGVLCMFPVAGIVWGAWWLITNQNNEYEYCVTNGDIDIDQIIAKRKRKRLVSVAGRKVETLLPYTEQTSTVGYQRVVITAPSLKEAGLWTFTYNSKKNGRTIVVFQPDQRVLKALYGGLPKLVQMDTRRAAKELGFDIDR